MSEPPMTGVRAAPVGVILAGGAGRRIGGSKAIASLGDRPLIAYPLQALRAVLSDVAVLAKADTRLPRLPEGVELWIESETTRHPLVGLIEALAKAGGRPVLICPVDLPFVTPELIAAIARADPGRGLAVVASSGERLQPLLGCYQPPTAARLPRSGLDAVGMMDVIASLQPRRLEVGDPGLLFNINTAEDLVTAAGMLEGRQGSDQPKVKL